MRVDDEIKYQIGLPLIDAIVEGLGWIYSKVANEILQAEFNGIILPLPGKIYKKNI